MKARYWLLPVFMLIGTWFHTLICEQLPQDASLLPFAVTTLFFLLIGLFLRRICTRKTVLISSAGLLLLSLAVAVLMVIPSLSFATQQFTLGLAYLWEALFFPFLSLPFPNVPVLSFLLPALIPFSWALFCKKSF